MTDIEVETPSLYEIQQMTRDADLVGEEDTALTIVLSMLRGGLVIMTGMSRGGKDMVVDSAEYCFPDDRVHQWPSSSSPTAPFEKADELNSKPVHRFPDLASLDKHIEITLKAFGEGNSVDHEYTDVSKRGGEEPALSGATLQPPKCQIAFIASDNQDLNLNDYPEVRNRGLVVPVDSSERLTRMVTERQAERRAGVAERHVDPLRTAQIRQYLSDVPVDQWTEDPNHKILNPATIPIQRQEPIPYKFTEARQDFDRVLEMMETVGLYHHADRMKVEQGSNNALLVTPADCWYAMRVFGQRMIMSTLNLRREDRAILEYLRDTPARSFDVSTIQQDLRDAGFNISTPAVRQACEDMGERGYVQRNDTSPITYSASDFASHVRYDAGIDWDVVINGGDVEYWNDDGERELMYQPGMKEIIYNMVDEETADEYVSRYATGDGLIVTDPITGEQFDITENPLREEIQEADDQIAELLSQNPYDDTDEDQDDLGVFDDGQEEGDLPGLDELEGEAQGTLSD